MKPSFRAFHHLGAICCASLAVAGCLHASKVSVDKQFDWELDGQGVVEIDAETSNGAIRILGTEEPNVKVHALRVVRASTKEKAEAFAAQIKIHAVKDGTTIRIYKEHPKPPSGVNVTVSYEVRCPLQMSQALRTSNGQIQIDSIEGEIFVRTSNGKITLEQVSGKITAQTSNGSVTARVKQLRESGSFRSSNGALDIQIETGVTSISAETSNGSIALTLPKDFNGQLNARTSNGSVTSDIPILVTGSVGSRKNQLSGKIGEGGSVKVELKTSNGSIRLKQW